MRVDVTELEVTKVEKFYHLSLTQVEFDTVIEALTDVHEQGWGCDPDAAIRAEVDPLLESLRDAA